MNLNIPVPKTPFFVTEEATGQQIISREWYRFFTDMGFALGYSTDGIFEQAIIAAGPPAETVIAGFVQALAAKILEADDHAAAIAGLVESLKARLDSIETQRPVVFVPPSSADDLSPVIPPLTEAEIQLRDVLTNDVSTARHGLAPKAPNDATKFLNGVGGYTVPAGTSTGTVTTTGSPASGNLTKFSGATSITNGDLSGDVSTSGTLVTALANTAVTPGSYTATNLTVDAAGRITAASNGSASSGSGIYEAAGTKPVAANFTLDNAGTASMADGTFGIVLTMPSSTVNIRFIRSNTGPNATFTMLFRGNLLAPNRTANIHNVSLLFRNSTSGRILNFGVSDSTIVMQRWTSYTAHSATVLTLNVYIGDHIWMKCVSDGTTLTYSTSSNGSDWGQITTETIATFLTATGGSLDQAGFGSINGAASGVTNYSQFNSFSLT